MINDKPLAQALADDPPPSAPLLSRGSIAMLVGTAVMIIVLYMLPANLMEQLGVYGYLGVFLLTLLSSAMIVLPSPALGAVALGGKVLNPWLVGLVGGVAAGLGEITGYVAGRGGSELAQ